MACISVARRHDAKRDHRWKVLVNDNMILFEENASSRNVTGLYECQIYGVRELLYIALHNIRQCKVLEPTRLPALSLTF
jgi:hypothetical protein